MVCTIWGCRSSNAYHNNSQWSPWNSFRFFLHSIESLNSTPEASLQGLWQCIIFLCLFCHGILYVVIIVHVLNSLCNWCFTLTVCCDVSHFLGSWTAHTTAECSVMLELLLGWRAFWSHIAHMQHACLHFYAKSHTLLHWIIVAVGVCVYDLLLAILNWTRCIINLLHFS